MLHVGSLRARFGFRHYSPAMPILYRDAAEPSVNVHALSSHTTGAPRTDSLKLAHLCYGHIGQAKLALLLGVPESKTPCHLCNIFKARAPSASTTDPSKIATRVGERVFIDIWTSTTVPAATTGWDKVCGALDQRSRVVDAQGCKSPNGAWAAKYMRWLHAIYAQVYGVKLECVRLNNDTILLADEVSAVLVELGIRRELTTPYLHFQNAMERYWQTMQRDAACMLAYAQRTKALFLFACLHGLDLRNVLMVDEGETMTRYEVASGKKQSLEDYRIFGATAYGVIVGERRQLLRLDKADPNATHGIYIGNIRGTNSWKLLTAGKIHTVGAGVIDEKTLIAKAPKAHLEVTAGVEALARDGQSIYEANAVIGTLGGNAPGGAAPEARDTQRYDRADGVLLPAPPLAVQSRPQRSTVSIVRFEAGAASRGTQRAQVAAAPGTSAHTASPHTTYTASAQAALAHAALAPTASAHPASAPAASAPAASAPAASAPAASAHSARQEAAISTSGDAPKIVLSGEESEIWMVPSALWPRFACKENDGAGWSAVIEDRTKTHVIMRFLEAKARDGTPWRSHPMLPESIVRLDKPVNVELKSGADAMARAQLASMAADKFYMRDRAALWTCALSMSEAPPPFELLAGEREADYRVDDDAELFLDAQLLPSDSQSEMMMAAMRSTAPKARPTQALVTLNGAPTWLPLPRTAKEAANLPNCQRWMMGWRLS